MTKTGKGWHKKENPGPITVTNFKTLSILLANEHKDTRKSINIILYTQLK